MLIAQHCNNLYEPDRKEMRENNFVRVATFPGLLQQMQ